MYRKNVSFALQKFVHSVWYIHFDSSHSHEGVMMSGHSLGPLVQSLSKKFSFSLKNPLFTFSRRKLLKLELKHRVLE